MLCCRPNGAISHSVGCYTAKYALVHNYIKRGLSLVASESLVGPKEECTNQKLSLGNIYDSEYAVANSVYKCTPVCIQKYSSNIQTNKKSSLR